ncbi:MAG: 2-phosphosulfolactate phosphatase [Desulfocapsaceae bacterium]|nr:2-phosphosulfolactate phosphatase [Desulfocapsaceae bacterium]
MLRVEKTDFVSGANQARGVVVIIDVFRAFSVACYCFMRGVRAIYPVAEIDTALSLQKELPGAILIGERYGKKLPGFDFGNSPTEIKEVDLTGKTVVQTTHAGTQGVANAHQAEEILTGAFVNAKATADYIRKQSPKLVTLVRMGLNGKIPSDEDTLCAEYLESLLLGLDFNLQSVEPKLRQSAFSERFFDPTKPWNPPSDFDLCLAVNTYPYAISSAVDEQARLFLRPQLTNFNVTL